MSSSGVSVAFAKCFILFMAIFILVQGGAYLGLSIYGLTQETCSDQTADISNNPFQFVVDLIYFISEKCGPQPTLTIPKVTEPINLSVDWQKSYMVTNRTYIFMITYAVISGFWIVGSLLVIASICGPINKLVSAIVFWPWFLFVIAGSMLDAVATGYHIYDVIQTTSAQSTFDYIGVVAQDPDPQVNVMTFLQTFDAYFITPAVVMTCISSRVVIVWLLNIFGTSFCLSLSRVLANQRKYHQHHKHHNKHHEDVHTSNVITPSTSAAYNAAQITNNSTTPYYPRNNEIETVEYVNLQNRTASLNATQIPQAQLQRQSSRPQSTYAPNAPALMPDVLIVEQAKRLSSNNNNNNNNNNNIDGTTYRKTDSHPDRLDYPPKSPTTVMPSSPSPVVTNELSSNSLLNNRYSSNSNVNQRESQRASDELRSQLPWSYTSMLGGGKPQPPRKPQQVQTYPQIPEPDYNEDNSRVSAPAGVEINREQQAYSRW